jgi:hypothetical protein
MVLASSVTTGVFWKLVADGVPVAVGVCFVVLAVAVGVAVPECGALAVTVNLTTGEVGGVDVT